MSTSAANLTSLAKPPNVILIDAIKETNKLEKLKLSIGACLDPDQYTIHHVSIDEFFTNPWKNKAVSVLLVNSESLTRDHWQEMYKFYRDGGIVVFFCSEVPQSLVSLDACVFFPASGEERQKLFASVDIASDQEDLKGWNQNAEAFVLSRHAIHPNPATFFYATENQRDGVVAFASFVHCTSGEHSIQYLRSLLSKVGLSLRSVTHLTPDYTPGRLFIDKALVGHIESRYLEIGTLVASQMKIQFLRDLSGVKSASYNYLPVLVDSNKNVKESYDRCCWRKYLREHQRNDQTVTAFNSDLYFRHLKTNTIGKVLLYVPVLNSTMNLFDGSVCDADLLNRLVVVADVQREGRGRGANKWISPSGCIAFSFFISRPTSSTLMKYCSWLQHISVLSIVDSIRSSEAYAETPLRLKWPNDIYTADGVKIGGVLVKSAVSSVSCSFVMGCGLNFANEKPTVSLLSILPKNVPQLHAEQVIAMALSRMEQFVSMLEEHKIAELQALYRKHWLHSGQKVTMVDTGELVEVVDLDKHGYLLVRSEEDGKTFSLQPDGNSFDMMHNLIRSKTCNPPRARLFPLERKAK